LLKEKRSRLLSGAVGIGLMPVLMGPGVTQNVLGIPPQNSWQNAPR